MPTLREAVVESLQHNLTIYFDVKGHANQVPLTVLSTFHLSLGFLTFSVALSAMCAAVSSLR